jgi:predicted metal-dependent HD superfamily phosphohydrolase
MDTFLKQSWQEITAPYSQSPQVATHLWEELQKAYTSPERHYHTLHHVSHLLHLADQYLPQIAQPTAFKLAIFYHDAVYVTTRTDNEEKSAQLAQDRLSALGLPSPEIAAVTEMILATKRHQPSASPDINLLLDFDLSILGAPWPEYLTYTHQIRKEYRQFSDNLYRNGRKKVLQHFLLLESIYKTPDFKARLEASARENMKNEIELLNQE